MGTRFVCLLILPVLLPGANPQAAATVNGETITSAQLDAVVRKQIEAIEERARQVRQAALEKLIDNLLLEQAARAEGRAVDEYLKRHVESVAVPDAEVDEAYQRSSEQFPGVLPAEAKYRIRRTLEDNRRAAALNTLLDGLRRRARVTNHLLEDRLAALEFAGQSGPALGDPNAPVTIIGFIDFECPHCRSADAEVKRVLERRRGRVRLVVKHFPLDRHSNAFQAARAGVCAERQGRFWALHDFLLGLKEPLDERSLERAAAAAGIEAAGFRSCMQAEESAEAVRQDVLLGRNVGVDATPAFFVNGQRVSAAGLDAAVERIVSAGDSRPGGVR
jgi:predicted DsbA family dithiol-disulfide isomerase